MFQVQEFCECDANVICGLCLNTWAEVNFEPSVEELEAGEADYYAERDYYDSMDDFNDGEFWG